MRTKQVGMASFVLVWDLKRHGYLVRNKRAGRKFWFADFESATNYIAKHAEADDAFACPDSDIVRYVDNGFANCRSPFEGGRL
jgi:hypothetical protein